MCMIIQWSSMIRNRRHGQVEAKLQGLAEVVLMLPKAPSLGSNADEPRSLTGFPHQGMTRGWPGDVGYTLQMNINEPWNPKSWAKSNDQILVGTIWCWDVGASCPSVAIEIGSPKNVHHVAEKNGARESGPLGQDSWPLGQDWMKHRSSGSASGTVALRLLIRVYQYIPIDLKWTCLLESAPQHYIDLQYSFSIQYIFTQ